jgi:membrane-associated protease RseP (regulator of RpoE activity)
MLVTFHEFGHYWVARRCGVRVLRFSVGFGKPLWTRIGRDGTEYVIAALPLGGYVKMLDEREVDVAADERTRPSTASRSASASPSSPPARLQPAAVPAAAVGHVHGRQGRLRSRWSAAPTRHRRRSRLPRG